MPEPVSLAAVFRSTGQLASRARSSTFLIWTLLTIPGAVAEVAITGPVLDFVYAALGLLSLYLQMVLTSAALSCGLPDYRFDPKSPSKGRFPSAFLMGIIWLAGVLGGLILLIIPGVVLMGRWSISLPLLLAEDATAMQSLRRSWGMTRGHWQVATLVALLSVVSWAPAFALAYKYPAYEAPSVALAIGTNALVASALVFGSLVFASLYILIRSDRSALTA